MQYLVLRKEDEGIKTLADFAKKGYSLAPIAANNAQYTIIDEYNTVPTLTIK
ncbi:hypothetical protein AABM34_24550 [Lysinibacillus fusiformis]